jgi:hypothetical protein
MSEADLMMWGMGVVIAKSHTDLLSENVKKSFKRKIEVHGEWYGAAPIGYLNKRDDRGRGIIVSDPIRAPIIKKLFESYATGVYTLSQITTKAKELGLRSKSGNVLTKSVIHRMMQNPFFYGEMIIKGEKWQHCHEPLISRETFKACEAVRMGWDKKPFQYRGKEFLFRGILKCALTGNLIVSDTKVKKHKDGTTSEWTYLISADPEDPTKKIWVREDEVIRQLEAALKSLKIQDPEVLKETMEYLTVVNSGKKHEFDREVAALKEEHSKIQNKLDKLLDFLAEGVLTKNEFLAKKEQLKERQYELTDLLATYDRVDDQFSKKLATLINITNNAYETFKGSTTSEKREMLNFIFSNLNLNGRKLDYTWAFPFSELAKLTNCPMWRGTWYAIRTSSNFRIGVVQLTICPCFAA